MKQIFTLIALFGALTAFGQSERVILVEQFTQASCGPCAGTNPVIFPIMEANNDKVASIAYQVSWPGYDPMHEQNPSEVNSRVDYYGVRAVPGTAFNGAYNRNISSTTVVTQANIDQATSQPASFDIDLEVDPYVNFQGLDIDLNIEATANATGSFVAHVVVIEDEIKFSTPPGSNGETDFRWVMKKMLPNSRGTELAGDWTSGQKETLSFSYEFENFYNWRNAGVVAFIQDNNNKEVMQAIYWHPNFEANDGDDVLAVGTSVSGNLNAEVDIVCGGSATPIVTIMNSGKNILTSCEIEYDINGSASQTYTWNGTLPSFSTTQVQLPEISYPIQLVGEMNVDVRTPNGNTDQYPENGKMFSEFLLAPNSTKTATFEIRPIIQPTKLSFKIFNSAGDVILEDGPFSSRGSKTYDLTLEEDECYSLEITNTYSSVNGTFNLTDENNIKVFSGTVQDEGTIVNEFGTYSSIATEDISGLNDWKVSPNPAVDQITVQVDLSQRANYDIYITDLLGNVIATKSIGGTEGTHSESVNISDAPQGVYFVILRDGQNSAAKRIIKQ